MLLGTHEHALDDKNRLTLPAKLRAAFADGLVMTRELDGCLGAYPRETWLRRQEQLGDLNTLSASARRLQRFFFTSASEGELDKQGRVVIPAGLKAHAKLGRDVVVAGIHDHLEIWDRAAWERELAEVEGSAEDVAERLAAQRD